MDYDCKGEWELCEDRLGFRVEEVRTVSKRLINDKCGRFVEACAKLNYTTGVCTIYLPRHAGRRLRMHERNHCRGWTHEDFKNKVWFPMEDPTQ